MAQNLDDMTLLRPTITRIGNRHYRKLVFDDHDTKNTTYCLSPQTYVEEDEPDCEDIETNDNEFKTSLDVPVDLVKFICGRKMETKLRIERETKTQIKLPPLGVEGSVVITGARKKDVISCKQKIELIIESSRQKIPPTHFISLPLYNDEIIRNLEEFKKLALETCIQSKGLETSIFVKPQKLHLTIVMLTLLTKKEVDLACSILEECYNEIIKPAIGEKPIKIKLKGVEYMNDDPSNVDVLYAKVHEMNKGTRLQKIANEVMKYFVMKGLGKDEYDRVKLHATIINTKLRETKETVKLAKREHSFGRISLDARQFTEIFKDFNFGEHHIDNIHISQRGIYDENGQYHCCKSLKLP